MMTTMQTNTTIPPPTPPAMGATDPAALASTMNVL